MSEFDIGQAYEWERDVRREHWTQWAERRKRRDPNGAFWSIIGPRRSGKTWALKALRRLVDKPVRVEYLDLSGRKALPAPDANDAAWLLIDEPGMMIRDAPKLFVEGCIALKNRGRRVVLAMTPGEFTALRREATPTNAMPKWEFDPIPPLDDWAVARMAHEVEWARSLLGRLPSGWSGSPFLIELLLSLAEKAPEPGAVDIDLLQRDTIREARAFVDYVHEVFHDGLDDLQRDVLRRLSRGERADTLDRRSVQILTGCGLIRDGRIVDPVLAWHLPPPLVLHHISDVHVGRYAAGTVDAKTKGVSAAWEPTVRDEYLTRVEAMAEPPHMVIISGDILEWGLDEEYAQAVPWMERLDALLLRRSHPDLPADVSRILIAPGNHDVDRESATAKHDAQARHEKFAANFGRWRMPALNKDPADRDLEVVDLGSDLNVEVVLLGSAEYGQQRVSALNTEVEGWEKDDDKTLVGLVEELWEQVPDSARASSSATYDTLRQAMEIIDPAVVNNKDLERLKGRSGNGRIRIVVLHHPVVPVPTNPEVARFASLLNAGAVRQALFESKAVLVLHGHQHTGWIGREQWPERHGEHTLTIVSAPTLGSTQTIEQNGYNRLRISREGRVLRIDVCRVVRPGWASEPWVEVPLPTWASSPTP